MHQAFNSTGTHLTQVYQTILFNLWSKNTKRKENRLPGSPTKNICQHHLDNQTHVSVSFSASKISTRWKRGTGWVHKKIPGVNLSTSILKDTLLPPNLAIVPPAGGPSAPQSKGKPNVMQAGAHWRPRSSCFLLRTQHSLSLLPPAAWCELSSRTLVLDVT